MPTLRLLPDLEDALRQLPGVRAASVVTDPAGAPTEVHVLASPGKAAKQVVRDVQSLAMARYDLDIDHRIVSVVQIGEEEAPLAESSTSSAVAEEVDSPTRPSIAEIMVRSSGGVTEAAVTLSAGEMMFEGKSEGPAGHSHRARLVAAATLDAVDELLGQRVEVESATVVTTGGRGVALSVLTMMVPRSGEQVLTGCALVRGDEADAIARSVLAALNRQLAG
jgi:hypothetical protein